MFCDLCTKHNLVDARDLVAENLGPPHTRWSSYAGDPRWARLDRIYLSHGGRWLAAAKHVTHHAGNTLSDHLPITLEMDIGTVQCTDGNISLRVPTTFKWSPVLLSKKGILQAIDKIWLKLKQKKDDPRRIYHKGMMQVQKFMRAKQREQRTRISDIQKLQEEIAALHHTAPGNLTTAQIKQLDWLETEKRNCEHERDVEI